MKTLGLVGAGHIGSQLARLALGHGYAVVLSNSRGPDTLGALVAELGRGARAATATEAAEQGDIVIVTIPLKAVVSVPVAPLAGNDPDAKLAVAALIDQFGFDAVDAGPLSESWRIEPNTPAYGPRMNARQVREALATAVRPPPT